MKYNVFNSVGKWLAAVGIWLMAIGYAQANVIVEDMGGGVTKVTIDPILLTASAAGEGDFLVIEDFWAVTSTACGIPVSSTMSYSINGGLSIFPAQFSCTGRYDGDFHGFDDNDLAFDFNQGIGLDIIAAVGDLITFQGMFTFSNNVDGIASTGGPYSIHLSGENGIIAQSRIFQGSAVPVPSTLALLVLGLLGMRGRGRRI